MSFYFTLKASSLSFVRLTCGRTTDKPAKFRSSWTPTQVCFYNTTARMLNQALTFDSKLAVPKRPSPRLSATTRLTSLMSSEPHATLC